MKPSHRLLSIGLATAALITSVVAHAQTALDDVMKAKKLPLPFRQTFRPAVLSAPT